MNKETYEEYLSGNVITHAAILNVRNIAFGLKEVQVDENDIRPKEERASAALSYAPDRLQHQGGFGHSVWGSGIDEIFVAYNSLDEGIIFCDSIYNTFEPKAKPDFFYPVMPKSEQDDYTRLSKNIKLARIMH